MDNPEKIARLTYYTKEGVRCGVCGNQIFKEEILSGGGRLVAGDVTDELHRRYEETKKYGQIYPLVYNLMVCANCYFTGFPIDFSVVSKEGAPLELKKKKDDRRDMIKMLFPEVDFNRPRTLIEGAASCILSVFCYEKAKYTIAPTFRQGVSALRAAWLLLYLDQSSPGKNYQQLAMMFYRKAAFFYRKAVELDETGEESFSKIGYLGPDTDNNYGFDGVQYLASLLEFRYGIRNDMTVRYHTLENVKKILSRIVGMGKSNRSKPSVILEFARAIYTDIKEEQKKIKESGVAID